MEDTNYRIAYENQWKSLKKRDPVDVAKRLGCKWDNDKKNYTLTFLSETYYNQNQSFFKESALVLKQEYPLI